MTLPCQIGTFCLVAAEVSSHVVLVLYYLYFICQKTCFLLVHCSIVYCITLSLATGFFEHVGNKRLKVLVQLHLQSYLNARTKAEKASVITTIARQVQDAAGPRGGFVKKTAEGEWVEVGLAAAREKVGKFYCSSIENPSFWCEF